MRKLIATLVLASLFGCASFESHEEGNKNTLNMKKPCNCAGFDNCKKDEQGNVCCSPDACSCSQSIK